MCGFLGAILINTTVDAALGYGTTEIGPKWSQRLPVAISRWHTLMAKWVVALVVVPVLVGVLLLVAVGLLGMNAPFIGVLWLFASFAAITIAFGTLVLFAALGAPRAADRVARVRVPRPRLLGRNHPVAGTPLCAPLRCQFRTVAPGARRRPRHSLLRCGGPRRPHPRPHPDRNRSGLLACCRRRRDELGRPQRIAAGAGRVARLHPEVALAYGRREHATHDQAHAVGTPRQEGPRHPPARTVRGSSAGTSRDSL